MAVDTAARVWGPYKELLHCVENAIKRRQPDALHDLEVVIRRHKPDFISLLNYPAKNDIHRTTVKAANKTGLVVQGQQTPQILSQDFIDESLIISDLFSLNEYAAVELLMAGDSQQSYFPGLGRGLVAVLLYYDGRASLVAALHMLLQARVGRTWSHGLSEDTNALISKLTDQLIAEGIVTKLLDLIGEVDADKEIARLQKPEFLALGPPKHRKQVMDKIRETQQGLADCVFCLAAQCAFGKQDTLRLIEQLRGEDGSSSSDGTLRDITLTLLMALLYCLDVRLLETQDSEEAIAKLPLLNESEFVQSVNQQLTSATNKWGSVSLRAVIQLAWSVTLRSLSQYNIVSGINNFCEQDESVADLAIENGAFSFLLESVIRSPTLHKEEYFIRQVHSIIADFIIQMPLKIKELRNRGDETARIIMANEQEGLEPPPNLPRHFETFLTMIGALYEKDPLCLELAEEYWCPSESMLNQSAGASMYNYRPPQRQVSLYKFVRLSGDLLSPPLYIPYIRMLTGLANGPRCAHYCFNLLKASGGSSMGGQPASAVSWDHFFLSINQYYSTLRQEVPSLPHHDLMHVYRQHPRGISPREMEGLEAVLRLTRMVIEEDEAARIALCENPQWPLLVLLLGLVSCSISPALKSQLLLTLAAFAKTPEIAANLWHSIECSQILPTVQSSALQKSGGIFTELDEVEARNEEFPLTRAFLTLIDVLTDGPIPAGLGAGCRAPGFTPYLDFLRDQVLLKFNSRAYRNPAEKWEVGSLVLGILYKLLNDHQVSAEDFVDQYVEVQGKGAAVMCKPPGHMLLIHMLNESPMFKTILYIVDEATRQLDKYISFPGQAALEKCSLLCLRMIAAALERQEACLDAVRETGAAIMLDNVAHLLLTTNPRSGRPDHLTHIARFITYNSWLPEHSLCAVRILSWACTAPAILPQIVPLFTVDENTSASILHGFVECLECDDPEIVLKAEEQGMPDEELDIIQVKCATRQAIVQLLLQNLDHSAPNLAHFLLGFDLRSPVSRTNLQDPGVLGCFRTCLHSLLSVLNRGVDSRAGPACVYEMPEMAELAYHLIYVLCANKDTCGPFVRYLRTHDLIYRHMQHLPFQPPHSDGSTTTESLLLRQMSWLLKAAAIELKLTASQSQRSHVQRLINLLLDDSPNASGKTAQADGTFDVDYTQDSEFTIFNSMQSNVQQNLAGGQTRRKLSSILDAVDFCQDAPNSLDLQFFPPALVESVQKSCQQKGPVSSMYTNIKLLHRSLLLHLNNLPGSAHRPHMLQELESICTAIVERNAYTEAIGSKRAGLEGWRQVVEVILAACPPDLLQGEARQCVILELLQDLLNAVSKDEVASELTGPVAGVILMLMANLSYSFITSQSPKPSADTFVSLLDNTIDFPSKPSAFGNQGGARTLFASSLQVVLKGLVQHMKNSSAGPQRVRAYIYGALLYYLQIAHKPQSLFPVAVGNSDEDFPSRILIKETEFDCLSRDNMETLRTSPGIMEIICRDACDGHDVSKMLALSCLDVILAEDKSGAWLNFITERGYLQHLVESLSKDDEQLQAMLLPQPEPLKNLYIFESKIALLTRVGETPAGAQFLLQCGVTAKLAQCSVLDLRPEVEREVGGGFVPSILLRYRRHILFPVMRMCMAMLTALGIDNRQAAHQVLRIIVAHADVFYAILRGPRNGAAPQLESLQELALTTGLVSRAAIDEIPEESMLTDTSSLEFRGLVSRLQRQMIALLPRYCLSAKHFKEIKNSQLMNADDSQDVEAQMRLAVEQVTSHVVAFCRGLVARSGSSAQMFCIIFSPSLLEAMTKEQAHDDLQSGALSVSAATAAGRPQNLGLVIQVLRNAAAQFLSIWDAHKLHARQLETLPLLSTDELKELCGANSSERLSSQQKQNLASRRLTQIMNNKAHELQHLSYVVENSLFLLWRHLEFYLIHCIPSDQDEPLHKLHARKQQAARRLQGPIGANVSVSGDNFEVAMLGLQSGGVSREDLDQLNANIHACVNDALFRKLQDIQQCYTKSRNRFGFMEALVRRVKRLLKLHTDL